MLDWAAVEQAGIEAAMAAMDRGTLSVEARARELAPVRKIFKGQDRTYRTRLKSIEEIESDRALRRKLGLGPERLHIQPPSIVVQRAPRLLDQREIGAPGTLKLPSAQARLDRRGRYEVRTMRAAHANRIGGGLRARIYSIPARLEGRVITSKVVSPAEYSVFQEMGTVHTPAHPYMRPAAHEAKEPLKADVARSVSAAVRSRMSGRIEVTIQTRVV